MTLRFYCRIELPRNLIANSYPYTSNHWSTTIAYGMRFIQFGRKEQARFSPIRIKYTWNGSTFACSFVFVDNHWAIWIRIWNMDDDRLLCKCISTDSSPLFTARSPKMSGRVILHTKNHAWVICINIRIDDAYYVSRSEEPYRLQDRLC
jgi:hypothetical protein